MIPVARFYRATGLKGDDMTYRVKHTLPNKMFTESYDIPSCYFNALRALAKQPYESIKLKIEGVSKFQAMVDIQQTYFANTTVFNFLKENQKAVYDLIKELESATPHIKQFFYKTPDGVDVVLRSYRGFIPSLCMSVEGYIARKVIQEVGADNVSITYDGYESDSIEAVKLCVEKTFNEVASMDYLERVYKQVM